MARQIFKGTAWPDMTDDQKFEFLHQWCENLERAINLRGAEIQGLHQRLSKVEEKLGGSA